jgi:hypothetical protein
MPCGRFHVFTWPGSGRLPPHGWPCDCGAERYDSAVETWDCPPGATVPYIAPERPPGHCPVCAKPRKKQNTDEGVTKP